MVKCSCTVHTLHRYDIIVFCEIICKRKQVLYGIKWWYETSGTPLRFMLRRSSLVECVSVLSGTCLQSVEKKIICQYMCSHVLLNIKRKGVPEFSYHLLYVRYHWNPEPVCNKSHFVSLFYLYWYSLIY
jgi:hypothetical protein